MGCKLGVENPAVLNFIIFHVSDGKTEDKNHKLMVIHFIWQHSSLI